MTPCVIAIRHVEGDLTQSTSVIPIRHVEGDHPLPEGEDAHAQPGTNVDNRSAQGEIIMRGTSGDDLPSVVGEVVAGSAVLLIMLHLSRPEKHTICQWYDNKPKNQNRYGYPEADWGDGVELELRLSERVGATGGGIVGLCKADWGDGVELLWCLSERVEATCNTGGGIVDWCNHGTRQHESCLGRFYSLLVMFINVMFRWSADNRDDIAEHVQCSNLSTIAERIFSTSIFIEYNFFPPLNNVANRNNVRVDNPEPDLSADKKSTGTLKINSRPAI